MNLIEKEVDMDRIIAELKALIEYFKKKNQTNERPHQDGKR